jgi:hypothetical protein
MKKLSEAEIKSFLDRIDNFGKLFLKAMAYNQLAPAIQNLQQLVRLLQDDIPAHSVDDLIFWSSWDPGQMQLLLERCANERYRQLVQEAPRSAESFGELQQLIIASRNTSLPEVISALPYPKGWRSWERKHQDDLHASLVALSR